MSEYPITPVSKPRMTRRDRWRPFRPCVANYWNYKEEVILHNVMVTNGCSVTFILPMPHSWAKKKKCELDGQPHTQTPDVDNLLKGLMDACP